jgi:hypothetical protein
VFRQSRRAALMVALSILFIVMSASKANFAPTPQEHLLGRGGLPEEALL